MSIDEWISSQYGGHFQYLTIQGLVIAGVTMASSVLLDLFPSSKAILTFKRALFMIAMPLAAVISSVYWMLLLLDPSLILQEGEPLTGDPLVNESIEKLVLVRIPLPVDLSLHLAPAVSLLLDFFVLEKKFEPREVKYTAPLVALAYTVFYGAWVEHCAKRNDGLCEINSYRRVAATSNDFDPPDPYPFLTLNPFSIRLVIYAGAGLFSYLSFAGLNRLHK
ncbi:hypothetical protein V5O48_008680 [Marasmius crinis-equi]|uniref:FAR-17a/AIG1-like protein n=1 Tax=Marasmius crinis-equi TaxID=585013 RepID=A0ABR3FDK5_9AGAR